MYLVAENGTTLSTLIPEDKIVSIRDNYHRATLNYYGVLTWYYHPRIFTKSNEVGWQKMHSLQGNICSVGCGYNSFCTYDEEAQNVICNCPSNYSQIDPNDKYGSCKPDFELWKEDGQDSAVSKYDLVPVSNTQFGDECGGKFFKISEDQFKSSCLNDHFCAVATWNTDNDGTCCKIKPPFNGEKNNSGIANTAWLKVGNSTQSTAPLIPSASPPEAKARFNTVVSVLFGGSVFVNFTLLSMAIFFIYKKKTA